MESKNYDISLSLFKKDDYVLLSNNFHVKATTTSKNIKIHENQK